MNNDIFISYKNDGEGNNFAARLFEDLDKNGYSVYFNSHEKRSGCFPDRLKNAILNCSDFLLIVSKGCIEQLMQHNEVDWVREELLYARDHRKNIIPILIGEGEMPKDKNTMPEDLRFLPELDACFFPEQYLDSPFNVLLHRIYSKPEKGNQYRNDFNNNPNYNVKEDFELTLQKAEEGDTEAMYEIATMYYYGIINEDGTSYRDFQKAYTWLKKISENDDDYSALALSMIANMYYAGIVPREAQSYKKSLEYHKQASTRSGYSAQQAACMMLLNSGCEEDFETAESYCLKIIEKGDNITRTELATKYMNMGLFEKASYLYEQMACDNPSAAYELGLLYKRGVLSDSKKSDCFRAAFYFQLAINSGKCNANVYYEMGLLYFNPIGGFPKDFKIAQNNFEKAANMGHNGAQYILGYMYEYGHVEKDNIKAVFYHTKAADNGHILSAARLAILYQQPEIKNYHKAFAYAKIAAESGSKEGEFIFANLLFLGRGCETNENEAYRYYKMAYEHGVNQAKFMIDKIENK